MSIAKLHSIIVAVVLGTTLALIVSAVVPSKADDATYTILSENGKTYYCNQFRIYGKGVMFDDVYGKTIIIQGDLEIIKKNKK